MARRIWRIEGYVDKLMAIHVGVMGFGPRLSPLGCGGIAGAVRRVQLRRPQSYGSRIRASTSSRLSGRTSAQTFWMYFRHSSLQP